MHDDRSQEANPSRQAGGDSTTRTPAARARCTCIPVFVVSEDVGAVEEVRKHLSAVDVSAWCDTIVAWGRAHTGKSVEVRNRNRVHTSDTKAIELVGSLWGEGRGHHTACHDDLSVRLLPPSVANVRERASKKSALSLSPEK